MRNVLMLCLAALLGAPLTAQDDRPTPPEPKAGGSQDPANQEPGKDPAKDAEEARRKAEEKARQDEADEEKRQKIEDKIREHRARLKLQGVVQSHIQVKVTLRNGEIMRGIVKNGLFVEKPTRLEFVRSEMQVAGAGIRLWYYDDTSGYIFLPYRTIKSYKIIRKMTDLEVADLHNRMLAKKTEAEDEVKKRAAILDEKIRKLDEQIQGKKDKAKTEADLARAKAEAEQEKRLKALLDEFPPEEGWGLDKAKEIRMRFLNLGLNPNEKEKRFLDMLEDWKTAFERYGEERAELKGGPAPKPKSDDGGVEVEQKPEPKPAPMPTPGPNPGPPPMPGGTGGM